MRSAEIKSRWLRFFEERGHAVVPSASLITDDPTLLFTVAGMVPFIPYLLGQRTPPWKRVTSVQKCVRTLDIEEVGKTTRHGTFFQMNGNFSFGDYFKEGAITYAWDLVTSDVNSGGLGFDPDKVWVTVFHDDDEAFDLWHTIAGLPEERIQRRGMKDNYWSTGRPGPAGPCSEIYIDRGPEYGPDGGPVVDEDRFLEIWNLVFMQYERGEGGGKEDFEILGELAQKNIDTGMGLERVAYLLQGVDNLYEIDEVYPVIAKAEELSGHSYSKASHGQGDPDDAVRMRVVADHVRSALMLIGDGVNPGNEGRGYVLRRLLRRSIRAMRLLGYEDPSLRELLPVSKDAMKDSYPELETDFERISRIAYAEEDAFRRTLTQGTTIFDTAVAKAKKQGRTTLSGDEAFTLHDTYGFPIDLTLEMATEQGLGVDEDGFKDLMLVQRERARADAKAKKGGGASTAAYQEMLNQGPTEFTGYTELDSQAKILGLFKEGQPIKQAGEGDLIEVVLDRTSLYAESGGQDSDAGYIDSESAHLEVLDVQRPIRGLVVHTVKVLGGEVTPGLGVVTHVDPQWRLGARQAHSGTHVVHAALRQVLGPSALQSGSYNRPGYLRLDFSWQEALSPALRAEVEEVSNEALRSDLPVSWSYMTLEEAKRIGALALFGETYDEQVRVVEIGGPWSRELCGGTHVEHSSQVGLIALTSESSVGAGSRRVEAFVGIEAFRHLARERNIMSVVTDMLKTTPEELPGRLEQTLAKMKSADKELDRIRHSQLGNLATSISDTAQSDEGRIIVTHAVDGAMNADDLRTIALDVRAKLGEGQPSVVAIAGGSASGAIIVVAVNAAASELGISAGTLARTASTVLGGGGGGKGDLAQGGGPNISKIPEALKQLAEEARTVGR